MIEIIKQKIIEHIQNVGNFSESDMEEVKKIFRKRKSDELDPAIFYCQDCKQNSIYNPTKSWMSGNYFHYHPKCPVCKKGMRRIVINRIEENEAFTDFFRKTRPKIFCFISSKGFINEWDLIVSSLAEDGEGLIGSHLSSNKICAKMDIGLLTNTHHDKYNEKYPDGFELIWINEKQQDVNKEFLEAYNLNCQKYNDKR